MRNVHIPHVMKTGYPLEGSGKIYSVKEMDTSDNTMYCIDYHFLSEEQLKKYRAEHGAKLGQEYTDEGWAAKTEVTRFTVTTVTMPSAN